MRIRRCEADGQHHRCTQHLFTAAHGSEIVAIDEQFVCLTPMVKVSERVGPEAEEFLVEVKQRILFGVGRMDSIRYRYEVGENDVLRALVQIFFRQIAGQTVVAIDASKPVCLGKSRDIIRSVHVGLSYEKLRHG